jgi:glycosyltransferase involved in cell wall biosynthesis
MKSKKEIRFFVDAHVFDGEFQGSRTYIKEIYSILIESRPDVVFYFGAGNLKNISVFENKANVRFVRYFFHNRILRLGLEIPIKMFVHRIDYAHFQYIIPFFKVCKYITTIHDVLFNDFKEEFSLLYVHQKNFFYKRSARVSEFVLTVSQYSKNRIGHFYPFSKNKLYVTPNAVNPDEYCLVNKDLSKLHIELKFGVKKYLLIVSRIEPRKRHDLLVKAYLNLKLQEKGYSIVFIGKQSLKNSDLDSLIFKNPELKGNLFRFDSIEANDLREFYNGAELFIYPSIAEGFGIPPLEAGILKTPVLCSSKTAMSDFSFFGDDLFDPNNFDEFKTKLSKKLENSISEENLNFVKKRIEHIYNWRNSAETISEIIK